MSNVVFELFAKLGLDSSEYEKGLGNAKSLAGSVGGAIGKGFKTMAAIGTAAIGTATAAATAFAGTAVKVGAEFDSSMSQIAATLGLTMEDIKSNANGAGDTFDALREKAREMGGSTIYSATESAEALNILAMSGYSAEESIGMVEDVLHLAAAGSMDMAQAASYVSGAMKGFNDETKDSAYYADMMAKGATLANTSVSQLGEAMSGGAASAAAYNQSADSMTIALLRLAEQGETGSAAGTALAAAMKDLYTGTDQAKAALKELGVEAYDPITKEAKDFNQVVNELEASMQGMTDEEKNNYKQTIFGIQGLNAYNKMVVTGIDKQEEWANAIANSSGEASKQYDTMTDNLEGAVKGWNSALDDFRIEISDQIKPALTDFVKFGTGGLQDITKAFQEGGITGAMAEFGTILSDGIAMITDMLPDAINAGMELLGAVGQGILDNLPMILDAAIQIVGQLGEGFMQAAPAILEGAITIISELGKALIDSLPTLIPQIIELVMNLAQMLVDNAPAMIDGAVALIVGLANGLIENLPTLIPAVVEMILQIVNALIEPDNLTMLITAALQIIVALAQGLVNSIPVLVQAIPTIIANLVIAIIQLLPEIVKAGEQLVTSLKEGALSLLVEISKTAAEIIIKFVNGIQEKKNRIISIGREMIDSVKSGIMQKIEDAKNWGKDLIANFIGGIKEKWENLKDTVANVAGSIKDLLGFSEPKLGPLSNFHTYAPDMMQLFAQGIRDNEDMLKGVVADAFDFGDMVVNAPPRVALAGADGGAYNQTINIYSPTALTPSEVARQTRNATRDMVLELRGKR